VGIGEIGDIVSEENADVSRVHSIHNTIDDRVKWVIIGIY
jgi:hypothetical protein